MHDGLEIAKDKNRKKKLGLCIVKHCKNHGRLWVDSNGNKAHKSLCGTHQTYVYRIKNPIRYKYDKLKGNAKRRRILFSITFEEFKKFCEETDYLKLTGRESDSMTIDRIIPELGYTAGNLQLLSKSDNSAKQHTDKKFYTFPIDTSDIVQPLIVSDEEAPF